MRPVLQFALGFVPVLTIIGLAAGSAAAQPGAARNGSSAEVRSPSEFVPIELHGAQRSGPEKTPIRRQTAAGAADDRNATDRVGSPWKTLGTLAALLVGAALAARVLRRVATGRGEGLSTTALDVLGSRKLDHQSSLHLVRIGRRVIAVGTSPAGLCALTEIGDPREVALLLTGDARRLTPGGSENARLFGGTPVVRRTHGTAAEEPEVPEPVSRLRRPSETVREARDA
jgi:flagellar biogenesis protein FliO